MCLSVGNMLCLWSSHTAFLKIPRYDVISDIFVFYLKCLFVACPLVALLPAFYSRAWHSEKQTPWLFWNILKRVNDYPYSSKIYFICGQHLWAYTILRKCHSIIWMFDQWAVTTCYFHHYFVQVAGATQNLVWVINHVYSKVCPTVCSLGKLSPYSYPCKSSLKIACMSVNSLYIY